MGGFDADKAPHQNSPVQYYAPTEGSSGRSLPRYVLLNQIRFRGKDLPVLANAVHVCRCPG